MGSNQSKPVRDLEVDHKADVPPVLTGAKKRKAKVSESAAVTVHVPEPEMSIIKNSANITNGLDAPEKRAKQHERRNKVKFLDKPVLENEQMKSAESDKAALNDKTREHNNITTKQNSKPESKVSDSEDKLKVNCSEELAAVMNDSDKYIACAGVDKQIETKGMHPSDDFGGILDSHIYSAVDCKTETVKDILQTYNQVSDETVKRQGNPVHSDRSQDTTESEVTSSRSGSAAGAEETQKGASGNNSYSGIQATTSGDLPNPYLNYKHLSTALTSSDLLTTSVSSFLNNSVPSTALNSITPCTTVLVSSVTTNSYPLCNDTGSTRLSALSSSYSQTANSSTQSFSFTGTNNRNFSFNGNNHGNFSFSGNNHGIFSFSGNNQDNSSLSSNTTMTAVPSTLNGSSVSISGSNYNFPPSLTNYSRRNLETNYNSDMYLTAITDSFGLTSSSSNVYPSWNALQTGIEMDGTQLVSSEALEEHLQNLISSYSENDYNAYDAYGAGYIGYGNSTTIRNDSNKSDLDGNYITVRTSVGDTSTRISAKNIKLSPQYRDGLTDENMGIILERPKYPRYATLASRIKSFEDLWPVTNQMGWEQLPEAGFVYTGTADCVRCYYCNGGLREWLKDDCAWTEHARYYPHCPHVRHCKGDEFIRTVRQGTDDVAYAYEEESDNDMEVDDEAAGNNALPRDLEAVKAAAEIITDQGLLDKAVYYLKTVQGKTSFDAQELASLAFEIEEGTIQVDTFPNTADVTDVVEEPVQTKDDDYTDDLETDCVMLEEETRLLKERSLCKVCLDATACVLFLECGHMIACPMCAPALKNCAVCRAEIKGTVRTHFAIDR